MALSKNSERQYKYYLNKYKFDYLDINNVMNNILNINANICDSTVKTILCAILWNLKQNKIDDKILTAYTSLINNQTVKTNIEEKDHDKHRFIPSWKDIITIRDNQKNLQTKILLSLYTYIPPRRLCDYEYLIYGKQSDKLHNFYDGEKLIFNTFKTHKSFGTQIVYIPRELKQILDNYIQQNNIKSGDILLNLCSRSICRILKNVLHTSIDGIRHSFINNFYADGIPSSNEMERIAFLMGHDLRTNLRYRKNV